jgi:chemotaxis signal transduction protein
VTFDITFLNFTLNLKQLIGVMSLSYDKYKTLNKFMNKKILIFSLAKKKFAFNALEIAYVNQVQAFLSYEGLPFGVKGITYYTGKIFPVLDLETLFLKANLIHQEELNEFYDYHKKLNTKEICLFSVTLEDKKHDNAFSEVAIKIFGDVLVSTVELVDELADNESNVTKSHENINIDYPYLSKIFFKDNQEIILINLQKLIENI